MARSLGQLTVDLALKTGSFETDAGRAAKIAEKRAKEIDAAFAAAGAAIGATIAAGVTTASVAIKSAINSMDEMSKAASRVQMPTEEFSKLAYAGDLADVSIQDLQSSLGKLSKSAAASLKETSEQAKVFQALGISVTDASGKLRSSSDLLMDFADAFKAMGDRPEAMAAGMSLFGKSFQTMIPLIKDGSAGLREAGDEAERLGMVLSTEAGRQAEAFNDNITRMQSAVSGLARTVAAELLPDMVRASEEVATWAKEAGNAERIANSLSNAMQAAGAVIDFAIITPFRVAGDVIEGATTATIGLMEALKGLVGMDLSQIKAGFNVWKEGAGLAILGSERMGAKSAAPNAAPTVKMITGRDLLAQDAARLAQAVEEAKKAEEFAAKLRAALGGADKPANGRRKGAASGKSEAQRQMEEAAKAAQQLSEAQDNARRTLEDWRAELDGPAAQALLKYSRMERELDEQVAAGEITWKQYADAMGMVSEMRAKDEALMTDQQKAAKALAEAQADAAQEYRRSWLMVIDSVSYAFGDFVSGGIRSFKDFGRELVNIARRFLGDLVAQFTRNSIVPAISNWFRQLSSGGFASAGQQGGGFFGQLLQGAGNMLSRIFGGGSASAQAAGTLGGFGNNVGALAGLPGAAMPATASLAMSPWLGAGLGALAGFQMGGDLPGKALAGASYGALGFGAMKAWGAYSAATAGGAGVGSALISGLKAIGPAAWVALGAIAIDKISGGKLFGTSYKADSAARQFSIADDGASGFTSTTQVKQRSLFRGRKWKTTTTALDGEAQAQINELFDAVMGSVGDAAAMLGVEAPALVAGTFRQEFDKNGNLKKEFATIAGQVYNEGQEAFAARLLGENLLAVAKVAGGAEEIERLAGDYRTSGETLQGFATLMLAVQSDIKNATQLWTASGEGVLTSVVQAMERLAKGGEELVETYQRVTGVAREYGQLIGGVESQLLTNGLNEYQRAQLDIEMGYRAQVKQANELAKSLGLTGARAEDLAKIEQLRAVNMASLQKQMEAQKNTFLQDLGLSDLSPLRDSEKLVESMQLLRDAAGAGDMQRAQQLSQQVLGFGRNLYASGADYNALYGQVTGLLNGMSPGTLEGFTETGLDNIADILEGLPDKFAQAIFQQAANITPLPLPPTTPTTPPPGGTTSPQPPGGLTDEGTRLLREILAALQRQGALLEMDSLNSRVNAL